MVLLFPVTLPAGERKREAHSESGIWAGGWWTHPAPDTCFVTSPGLTQGGGGARGDTSGVVAGRMGDTRAGATRGQDRRPTDGFRCCRRARAWDGCAADTAQGAVAVRVSGKKHRLERRLPPDPTLGPTQPSLLAQRTPIFLPSLERSLSPALVGPGATGAQYLAEINFLNIFFNS